MDNKSLIRCFSVKYRRIFFLVVCILTRPTARQNTAQLVNRERKYGTTSWMLFYRPSNIFYDLVQIFLSDFNFVKNLF